MKKPFIAIALSLFVGGILISCSSETEETSGNDGQNQEVSQKDKLESQPKEEKESPLGAFEGLVGDWNVDKSVGGVNMDLTFGEDGSFSHTMGKMGGEGTWEILDEETINIVTQNTKGQTWKITDIKEDSFNFCWNPESANPKTVPAQRVK